MKKILLFLISITILLIMSACANITADNLITASPSNQSTEVPVITTLPVTSTTVTPSTTSTVGTKTTAKNLITASPSNQPTEPPATETPSTTYTVGESAIIPNEADFSDDCVLVILYHEYSIGDNFHRIFTPQDFPEVELVSVKDLTYINNPDNLVSIDLYCKILKLDLKNKGQDQVLNAIQLLKNNAMVKTAEPDYFYYPED